MLMGPFLCAKIGKIDVEENNFNKKFGTCSFFSIKRPIDVESHMYKVTNSDKMYFRSFRPTFWAKI